MRELRQSPEPASGSWWTKASVRANDRRRFQAEVTAGQRLFPARLMPYLDHPSIQCLSPDAHDRLTARHLYRYLLFTTDVEGNVVNVATLDLANGLVKDPGQRAQALQIYTDESFHALMNLDLVNQIEAATRIPVLSADFAGVKQALEKSADQHLPGETEFSRLLQVIVFETTVTSTLRDVPVDPQTVSCVRELVADHARDEGVHFAFFSNVLRKLWPSVPRSLREAAMSCMRDAANIWLRPDYPGLQAALEEEGLTEGKVREVLEDSCATREDSTVLSASQHTRRLLLEITGAQHVMDPSFWLSK